MEMGKGRRREGGAQDEGVGGRGVERGNVEGECRKEEDNLKTRISETKKQKTHFVGGGSKGGSRGSGLQLK